VALSWRDSGAGCLYANAWRNVLCQFLICRAKTGEPVGLTAAMMQISVIIMRISPWSSHRAMTARSSPMMRSSVRELPLSRLGFPQAIR